MGGGRLFIYLFRWWFLKGVLNPLMCVKLIAFLNRFYMYCVIIYIFYCRLFNIFYDFCCKLIFYPFISYYFFMGNIWWCLQKTFILFLWFNQFLFFRSLIMRSFSCKHKEHGSSQVLQGLVRFIIFLFSVGVLFVSFKCQIHTYIHRFESYYLSEN